MQIKTDLRKLVNETDRLATFDGWPIEFITKESLAKNGFFYKGENDSVICIFCGVELSYWEEGDDPGKAHQDLSPECPLFHLKTDTRTIMRSEDECGCLIGYKKPKKYSSAEERYESFKDWPISMKQSPKAMAQAGFYYTGKGDKVTCFTCEVGLNKWEETDDPWVEHAKWYPSCRYVLSEKGEAFVREALETKRIKDEEKLKLLSSEVPINEQLLCSVCKSEQRTVVSLPCRHLATCKNCNQRLVKCPVCRQEETENLEVFLS